MPKKDPNPAVALVTCPTCDYPNATAHRTRTGLPRLYGFCPHCGVREARGVAAQWWFHRNARPLDDTQPETQASVPTEFELLYHRGKAIPMQFELRQRPPTDDPPPARKPTRDPAPAPAPDSPDLIDSLMGWLK